MTTATTTKHDPMTPAILRVVHEIVDAAGMRDAYENASHFHLRIEHEPYECLVIESWPTPDALAGERRRVSIAHYFEQNGDLIADPDLEMTDLGYPVALQQVPAFAFVYGLSHLGAETGGYQRITWRDEVTGRQMINTRLKLSTDRFTRMWASNLRKQGFVKKAREMGKAAAESAK